MSDVVERLHDLAKRFGRCSDQETCIEAADEIERLQEALNRIANAAEDAAVWWLQDLARAASQRMRRSNERR